jgi:hypothetical protein
MRTLRQKLIDSTNHTLEDMGDWPNHVRMDRQAALMRALEDTLIDNDLRPIREYARRYRLPSYREDREAHEAIQHDDEVAWTVTHFLVCTLRCMMPRWEYSANWLFRRGYDPPRGTEELIDA